MISGTLQVPVCQVCGLTSSAQQSLCVGLRGNFNFSGLTAVSPHASHTNGPSLLHCTHTWEIFKRPHLFLTFTIWSTDRYLSDQCTTAGLFIVPLQTTLSSRLLQRKPQQSTSFFVKKSLLESDFDMQCRRAAGGLLSNGP